MEGDNEISFSAPRRLAAGFAHNLSLVTPEEEGQFGQVRAWGRNVQNVMGFRKFPADPMLTQPIVVDFFKGRPVFEVACGHSHSAILEKKPDQDGGTVWCFGLSTHGRLGIAEETVARMNREAQEQGAALNDPLATKQENVTLVPQEAMLPPGIRIARIAAGADHMLGLSEYGQVLAGATSDIWTPALIHELEEEECVQVAAGSKHSMALTSGGKIWSWGHGGNGRLGLGAARTAALVPMKITDYESEDNSEKTIVFIECGESHSGCIDNLGRVYTWGAGGYCRTGHGQEYDQSVPKQVDGLRATPCESLSFGVLHSLALTMKGQIYGWGAGVATGLIFPGEALVAPIPRLVQGMVTQMPGSAGEKDPTFAQIAAGSMHSVAVTVDGDLYTWGQSSEARLGLGEAVQTGASAAAGADDEPRLFDDEYRPKRIKPTRAGDRYGWSVPLNEHSVAGARKHARQEALKAAAAGGGGMDGGASVISQQLIALAARSGNGNGAEQGGSGSPRHGGSHGHSMPSVLPKGNAAQVECGGMFTTLRTKDGSLWSWGSNEFGQVGCGPAAGTGDVQEPWKHMTFREPVSFVVCGFEHCMAISGGFLYSWGRNNFGQLGTGRGRDLREPTLVESLADVRYAACGEDHSACALTSGELYTWGNAENGKLGHGSSLVSGTQMLPRQVRLSDRIVAVKCGQQHTAILNAKGVAFAFGVGWFGRLGLGHKKNAYTPSKVNIGRVESLSLGSYHSAFVTDAHELWMCGRDRLVLAGDHVDDPYPIPWFQDRNLKIRHVSAGPFFTLCLDEGGLLYVFGDNSRGQLGLGRKQVRVEEPERVRFYDDLFVQASCGSNHCMVMSAGGVSYGAGNRLAGRLALQLEEGKQEKCIWAWHQNIAPWDEGLDDEEDEADEENKNKEAEADPDALGEHEHGSAQGESSPARGNNLQNQFLELQKDLREEPSQHKTGELQKKENMLAHEYSRFMNEIYSNYDEDSGPYRKFSKLKQMLEQQLTRLYKALDIAGREPVFLKRTRVHPEVQDRLLYFNQLVWVLQSQPAFLARLGTRVPETKGGLDGLWMRIVQSVFRDRANVRVRTVFKALIRLVMKNEADVAKKFEDLWLPSSKTARLFEFLACGAYNWLPSANLEYVTVEDHADHDVGDHGGGSHQAGYGRVFSRILDVTNPKSLLSLTFSYTLERHNKQKADVFWALDAEENFQFLLRCAQDRKEAERMDEDAKRSYFQETARQMRHFLHDVFFQEFFNKIQNCLSRDLACLLQRAYLMIEDLDIAFHFTTKATGKAMPDSRISTPMVNLLLGHFLAPVLISVESFLTPFLRKVVRKKCHKIITEDRGFRDTKQISVDQRVSQMVRQFYTNVSALGLVLKKTVTGEWTAAQNLMQGISMKQVMPTALQIVTKAVADQGGKNLVDSTETELTIDLYARHFNPGLTYVQVATSDLLKFCNLLHTCIFETDDGVPLVEHEQDVRMDPGNDVLERLLDAIQPRPPVQHGEKRPARYDNIEARMWSREKIIIVEQTDGIHNFIVDHRFILHYRLLEGDDVSLPGPVPLTFREKFLLEDRNKLLPKDQKVALLNRMREVCFCRDSQVSMPRFLTGSNQKSRSGVRYVKPYQSAPAELPAAANAALRQVLPAGQDAFRFLELLLEDVSDVKSKDFLSLKYEFEEKQRAYQQLIPPNYDLANRLEKAKKVLDILKGEGVKEKEFVSFVDEALQARQEHYAYLQQVENGKQKVNTQREAYKTLMAQLAHETDSLTAFARTGEISKTIRQRGMDYNVKLRIPAAEKRLKMVSGQGGQLPAEVYGRGNFDGGNVDCRYLRSKKIIVRLGEHISPELVKNLHLEFRQVAEYIGKTVLHQWEVVVIHKDEKGARRNLQTFNISMEELDLMRESSGKLAKMDFADKFITLQCNKLLQMLVRI
eukprot:g4607.t1